ncbi:MAG: tetratricopeptide repeat protein [candidate division WOR-3 bacterium]
MKCPKCNFENPESAKFCQECGMLLLQPSKEELRLVTVLFADLSGFTKLSHNLDPEDVQDVINICFEYINRPIIKYGGTIHKYEGDLVIALFGLPFSHEDDPERAVKASLEMMNIIPEMNEVLSSRLKIKTELGLHIGINSGVVAVGEVGSKEKREYTVMGDVVNLASRLKDVAGKNEIIVSESVFKASSYLFEYEILSPVHIKGIEGEVKIFKPLKIKEKPEPKRGIRGLYSPMVGRDKELELLKELVKRLKNGRFIAAFIFGDAGLGKSRLWEEIKSFVINNKLPIIILEARCLSYSDNIPYWPFLQVIKKFFDIEDSDSQEIVKEKILKKSEELFADEYKDIAPYLGYLFSIRFNDELDEKIRCLEPRDLKVQLFLSVRKLLARISQTNPLILAIDDFHWIDPVSLSLIDFIFEAPEQFPLLFLFLSRIEKEKPCYKLKEQIKKKLGNNYLEIILNPLDKDSSAKLLSNLLKVPGFEEDFRNNILLKAEGNPFYLEEIIRSFIDSGILVFEDGLWKCSIEDPKFFAFKIPDTVQAVIVSRLDRLNPELRMILEGASVMGRNFYVRVLQNIYEFDEFMLSKHLSTLEEFGYIQKFKSEPELEYIFRHPLLQEVVYNTLFKKKRRELHRRIGETLEKFFHNRLDDFTEILAYQYANSDHIEKATEWLKKAGKKAKERFVNDEAIAYFEKVISILKENPEIKNQILEMIECYESLGDIQNLKGEYEKAIENYRAMFEVTKDNIVKARASRKIASIYQKQGRLDDSLKVLQSAQELLIGDSEDEVIEKSEIYLLRSLIFRIKGEMEMAIKECETGLRIVEKSGIDEKKVKPIKAKEFNALGTIFWSKGEYDRAIEFYKKSLRIFEEIGDKLWIGVAYNNLGNIYQNKGEYENAIEFYQRSLKICEEIGNTHGIGAAYNNLGGVYFYKGEYDRAIEFFQKFLRICEEIGDKHGIGYASNNLGVLYTYKDEYDKAIEFYEKGLKINEEIGEKRAIGRISSNLGMVYFNKGEYDMAIKFYKKSLIISEEIGDKRGMGIASENLGRIYLEIGKLKESEGYLLKSKNIFEEIGDKFELIETYCLFSRLLIKKGEKFEKAIEESERALKLAEEINSKDGKAICYFTCGKIYSKFSDMIYQTKAKEYLKKAIEIYQELKRKRLLAESYLEYAKILKSFEKLGEIEVEEKSEIYFKKALEIYDELKLSHKVKEIEEYREIR